MINRTLFIVWFCLIFNILSLSAQETTIRGNVKLLNGELLSNVTFIIQNEDDKVLKYTFSNEYGEYLLSFKEVSGLRLIVSYIGFKSLEFNISDLDIDNNIIYKNIVLEENLELKEIVIRPENTEQDTVNVNLLRLKLKDDDNLATILKKNPNFNVDNDGTIIYKGKIIDKILLNGKDFFTNQNSIALDKIENRMISGIQVVNNYRNTFSLNDEIPDETVLNINAKSEFKNIITGSTSAGYGINNKFDIQGSALRFSESFNAFLINNTNNIARPTIKLRELQNIFSNQKPLSSFQIQSLNDLFKEENRKDKTISNSNLTIRKQTNKSRLNMITYFLYDKEEDSGSYKISNSENELLLARDQNKLIDVQSFFNNLTFDYILASNQMLNYSSDIVVLNTKNSISINSLGNNDNVPDTEVFSKSKNNGYNLFNKLTYSNRVNSRFLFSLNAELFNEKSDITNNIENEIENLSIYKQNYDFTNNSLSFNSSLNYSFFKKHFIYTLFGYNISEEKLNDNIKFIDNKRTNQKLYASINSSGNKICNNLDYKLSFGVNYYKLKYRATTNDIIFLPYIANISYENKENRLYFSSTSNFNLNSMESGVQFIRNNGDIAFGDEIYPTQGSKIYTSKIGYIYNNIFKGKKYEVSAIYKKIKNQLNDGFDGFDIYGLGNYGLFVIPNSYDLKITGLASKVFFSKKKFPIKADVSISYNKISTPIYSYNVLSDGLINKTTGALTFESITDQIINFETSLSYTRSTNKFNENFLDANYLNGFLKIKLDYRKIRSEVSYIYKYDDIINNHYKRQNINIGMSYMLNKMTFIIEGENIDEFFGIFNNNAYNTRFSVTNGISQLMSSNKTLKYLIFKIKFKY